MFGLVVFLWEGVLNFQQPFDLSGVMMTSWRLVKALFMFISYFEFFSAPTGKTG